MIIRVPPHVEPGLIQELEDALRVLLSRPDARATVNAASATIYLNGLEEAKAVIDALHQAACGGDRAITPTSSNRDLIDRTCLTL